MKRKQEPRPPAIQKRQADRIAEFRKMAYQLRQEGIERLVNRVLKRMPPPKSLDYQMDLRSLAVDKRGTVYTAATGCRCVLKITSDGQVRTILKAERPWSPTGVVVFGEDVYVLEYTNANGARTEEWLPRVRKLGRDGKVRILATISEERERRSR